MEAAQGTCINHEPRCDSGCCPNASPPPQDLDSNLECWVYSKEQKPHLRAATWLQKHIVAYCNNIPVCASINLISSGIIIARTQVWGRSRWRGNWSFVPWTDLAVIKIARYAGQACFSAFNVWIEDLLLTIGSRNYCRLRVGLRSCIGLFECSHVRFNSYHRSALRIKSVADENRSSVCAPVVHSLRTIVLLFVQSAFTTCTYCAYIPYTCCKLCVIKNQKSRFVKLRSRPEHWSFEPNTVSVSVCFRPVRESWVYFLAAGKLLCQSYKV